AARRVPRHSFAALSGATAALSVVTIRNDCCHTGVDRSRACVAWCAGIRVPRNLRIDDEKILLDSFGFRVVFFR
ncbi:MAG: hypothetical protein KGQ57_16825, partial [Burkholderiales bacterium]|nr:hypothetical protein [Burkholderiales bacterium]